VEEDKAAELHFYDSIHSADLIPQNARVLDIGTGAGFPGIPLKIARPDIRLTMMDSVGKKTKFVLKATEKLSIEAEVLCARAEDEAQGAMRESFDCCTSRAVASLRMLAELCLPYVRVGGLFLAYKADYELELKEAEKTIHLLGGTLEKVIHSDGDSNHTVLVIRKLKKTPQGYPRRFARILKNPL